MNMCNVRFILKFFIIENAKLFYFVFFLAAWHCQSINISSASQVQTQAHPLHHLLPMFAMCQHLSSHFHSPCHSCRRTISCYLSSRFHGFCLFSLREHICHNFPNHSVSSSQGCDIQHFSLCFSSPFLSKYHTCISNFQVLSFFKDSVEMSILLYFSPGTLAKIDLLVELTTF